MLRHKLVFLGYLLTLVTTTFYVEAIPRPVEYLFEGNREHHRLE